MFNPITIGIGKLVQGAAGLRGGGSALPGLVVEKLDRNFAARILNTLPYGVVLVSGTNGKTTTVKVVTELLTAAGLRVFTNNTGSNFMRGVISSLLRKVSLGGKLAADIAVLELDEAHAVNFVAAIKPRYALLLNVMRDQLDRFGEIDYTAELLSAVARNTTDVLVLNREDSRLAAIPKQEELQAEVRWFGLAPELQHEFPDDDALLHGLDVSADTDAKGVAAKTQQSEEEAEAEASTVLLTGYAHTTARYALGNKCYETPLALKGIYNAYNAAAALSLVHAVLPETPLETLTSALSHIQSAFGRGESVEVDGQSVELILVKNPGGFRLALKSFDPTDTATMIVMNDDYGDGRDVSWYYDVDFSSLKDLGVAMVSGSCAYDMALRLSYDEVPLGTVEQDISAGLDRFLAENPDTPRRIYCSYTMMIAVRKLLATKTEMEAVR